MLKGMMLTALWFVIVPRGHDVDTASVSGRVTENTGAAIPGATVSVRNVFSGQVAATRTDLTGSYKLAELRQGRYTAFARAEGYGCVWVPNVFLHSGKDTRVDFIMRTGHASQKLTSLCEAGGSK